jgi:hypothetical protein
MLNAERHTQPIETVTVVVTTTPEKLEAWRRYAAERGIADVALWFEILAYNAMQTPR